MNERIKELIEEAVTFRLDPDSKCYESQVCPEDLEYLAELIVRECAKVCRDQPNVYALKADRDNCAIAIEEHFGVEE